MSFSSQTKEELSKLSNLNNKEMVQAEYVGYLISKNTTITSNDVKYSTESEYNINRFSKLLNNNSIIDYDIDIQGKIFTITFNKLLIENNVLVQDNKLYISEISDDEEYLKALIRGLFLGAGSMNNPQKKYHLEIAFSCKQSAEIVKCKLEKYDIKMKFLKNKKSYSLYLKDGEEISKFLAFIGANSAMLKFEEIRVVRHMNNKVNRLVNCETANLNKTINAAVEQIEAIEYLKKVKIFDKLDATLKEIAEVRLEHPDAALSELGGYLKNPLGKSGVNYRLKKIIEIAKEN